MNILYDNIIYSLQHFGGISVVWSSLLERAIRDEDLSIRMLDYKADNSGRDQLQPRDNQLVRMPLRWMERYREPKFVGEEPTIFHSSYFRIINHPRVQNITTIHDLTYHYYRRGLAQKVHLWQEAKALTHSAGIICVSKNTKKDLLQQYPLLDEDKIHVVYNGVSEAFQSYSCTNITPFETRGYLLYVGNRSAAYKNFVAAVGVARLVQMPLVIVGSALLPAEKNLLCHSLGATHYWVKESPNQDELVAIYNHAYCLLYPSAYEGFGLPILEAQRTGCLVIGQEISSIPEVMGKGGICVVAESNMDTLTHSLADALKGLLNGTINAQTLIEEGKRNSQNFTWDKCYELTKKVYSQVNQNKA